MSTAISAERRVVLHNVSWETYESLLADLESRSAPRLTFDCGVLEIMSPRPEHETVNRTLAAFVEIYAEELQIDFLNLGSTTFRREDLQRGFEPDSCFYFSNAERIRGKSEIDLSVDPPPDLVIEIDLTRDSLDKFELFARLGIPEVWHYQETLRLFTLKKSRYVEAEASRVLPGLSSSIVGDFIAASGKEPRLEWLKRIRSWLRSRQR